MRKSCHYSFSINWNEITLRCRDDRGDVFGQPCSQQYHANYFVLITAPSLTSQTATNERLFETSDLHGVFFSSDSNSCLETNLSSCESIVLL